MRKRLAVLLAVAAVTATLIGGCTQLQDWILPAPRVPAEWQALLHDVRAFERRIGFRETENFRDVFAERGGYRSCGHASKLSLPYSYQDPAIRWVSVASERECRETAGSNDVFYAELEAVGEIGASVTSMMLESKLDRFLYLVIHEDCHDQFDLPFGIEEALCELITYKAMAAFSVEKYGAKAREDRAVRRYTELQSRLTRATIQAYDEAEQLYARHARQEISTEQLLRERTRLYNAAERALEWSRGTLDNVALASNMTYSRHYPLLESMHDALGGDLARTVAFFRRVDREKPARAALLKQLKLTDERSVQFVRAYETAVVETVRRAHLAQAGGGAAAPARIK
jgi:hypothetical protein